MKFTLLVLCTICVGLATALPLSATVLITSYQPRLPQTPELTFRITWDDDIGETAKQVLLWDADRGVLRPISEVIPANVHEFLWQVPSHILPGNRYRFVVRNPDNVRQADYTDGFVPINPMQPLLTGVTPTEGVADIHIDPFPADDHVQVSWGMSRVVTQIELLNIHYEQMKSIAVQAGSSSVALSTKQLPSGLALVRLVGSDGLSVIQPLVIAH